MGRHPKSKYMHSKVTAMKNEIAKLREDKDKLTDIIVGYAVKEL